MERALARLGERRRVRVTLPSFLAVAQLIATSELVAALPARLVAVYPGLVSRPLPVSIDPMSLVLGWHPRWTTDPRHRWLRERLFASVRAGAKS